MSYRNMRIVGLLFAVSVLSVTSCLGAESERGMSPTDVAARQRIKYKAMDAASDGVITTQERRDIIAEAKYVLKPEEMEGLKAVLDRYAPAEPQKVVRHQETLNSKPRTATHVAEFKNDTRPFLSKLVADIPYVDGSTDSMPSARSVAREIPYVGAPKADMRQLKPLVSSLPRRDELYIEQPRLVRSGDETTKKLNSQSSAKRPSTKEKAYVSTKAKGSTSERSVRIKRSSDEQEVSESETKRMYADSSVAPETVPTSVASTETEKPAAKAMYEQSLNPESSSRISRR